MTGAACGAGNAYPSGAPDFTSGFHIGSCCPVICVSLFTCVSCLLDLDFWLFLLFDCLVSLYFYFQKCLAIFKLSSFNLSNELNARVSLCVNVSTRGRYIEIRYIGTRVSCFSKVLYVNNYLSLIECNGHMYTNDIHCSLIITRFRIGGNKYIVISAFHVSYSLNYFWTVFGDVWNIRKEW